MSLVNKSSEFFLLGSSNKWCWYRQVSCPSVRALFILRLPYLYDNIHPSYLLCLRNWDTETPVCTSVSNRLLMIDKLSVYNHVSSVFTLKALSSVCGVSKLVFRDVTFSHQQLEWIFATGSEKKWTVWFDFRSQLPASAGVLQNLIIPKPTYKTENYLLSVIPLPLIQKGKGHSFAFTLPMNNLLNTGYFLVRKSLILSNMSSVSYQTSLYYLEK